jgi:hypothetical protein
MHAPIPKSTAAAVHCRNANNNKLLVKAIRIARCAYSMALPAMRVSSDFDRRVDCEGAVCGTGLPEPRCRAAVALSGRRRVPNLDSEQGHRPAHHDALCAAVGWAARCARRTARPDCAPCKTGSSRTRLISSRIPSSSSHKTSGPTSRFLWPVRGAEVPKM